MHTVRILFLISLLFLPVLICGLPLLNLQFADSLFFQGDYYNSATEYERYLFYNPNDSFIPAIKYKLAQAYIKSKEIDKAEKILRELISSNLSLRADQSEAWQSQSSQKIDINQQAQIDLAKLYISQNELFRAKIELNDMLLFNNSISDSIKKEANYLLGSIALQESEPKEAINYFSQTQDSLLVNQIKTLKKLPKKNVLFSQILSSVIPGTGEMYCGKYGLGFLSLLVSSACVYGMVLTYKNKQYVDFSIIFSMFFTRFYNGSRNNARDFAKKYNERIYQERLKEFNVRR